MHNSEILSSVAIQTALLGDEKIPPLTGKSVNVIHRAASIALTFPESDGRDMQHAALAKLAQLASSPTVVWPKVNEPNQFIPPIHNEDQPAKPPSDQLEIDYDIVERRFGPYGAAFLRILEDNLGQFVKNKVLVKEIQSRGLGYNQAVPRTNETLTLMRQDAMFRDRMLTLGARGSLRHALFPTVEATEEAVGVSVEATQNSRYELFEAAAVSRIIERADADFNVAEIAAELNLPFEQAKYTVKKTIKKMLGDPAYVERLRKVNNGRWTRYRLVAGDEPMSVPENSKLARPVGVDELASESSLLRKEADAKLLELGISEESRASLRAVTDTLSLYRDGLAYEDLVHKLRQKGISVDVTKFLRTIAALDRANIVTTTKRTNAATGRSTLVLSLPSLSQEAA